MRKTRKMFFFVPRRCISLFTVFLFSFYSKSRSFYAQPDVKSNSSSSILLPSPSDIILRNSRNPPEAFPPALSAENGDKISPTSVIEQEIDEAVRAAVRGPEAEEVALLAKKIHPLIPPDGDGFIPQPVLPDGEYPKEVRCPAGWQAQGPHCLTIISAPPYTECPGDASLKKRGLRAKMLVTEPGVCAVTESTGIVLKCPPGGNLEKTPTEDPEMPYQYQCTSVDIIPYSLLGDTNHCPPGNEDVTQRRKSSSSFMTTLMTMDVNESDDEKECRPACPLGYRPSPVGCRAERRTAPDVNCPKDFSLGGVAVNAYAFRGKEYAKCGRVSFYKGKFWCPQGFSPLAVPFPKLPFGARMDTDVMTSHHMSITAPQTAARRRLDSHTTEPTEKYQYNNHLLQLFLSTSNHRRLQELPAGAGCVQPTGVFSANCDRFECKSPHLKQVEKTLRHWLYYRLEGDPDEVQKIIPNGQDLDLL